MYLLVLSSMASQCSRLIKTSNKNSLRPVSLLAHQHLFPNFRNKRPISGLNHRIRKNAGKQVFLLILHLISARINDKNYADIKLDIFYLFYENYINMSIKSDEMLVQFHHSSFALPPCEHSEAEGMKERVRVLKADFPEP